MAAVDTAATGHDRLRALWSLIEFTRPMMSLSILLFSSTGWQGRKKTHDTGRIKKEAGRATQRRRQRTTERLVEERSRRLSASHSLEVREVREECFQGLQPCPTCAPLRMHRTCAGCQQDARPLKCTGPP